MKIVTTHANFRTYERYGVYLDKIDFNNIINLIRLNKNVILDTYQHERSIYVVYYNDIYFRLVYQKSKNIIITFLRKPSSDYVDRLINMRLTKQVNILSLNDYTSRIEYYTKFINTEPIKRKLKSWINQKKYINVHFGKGGEPNTYMFCIDNAIIYVYKSVSKLRISCIKYPKYDNI